MAKTLKLLLVLICTFVMVGTVSAARMQDGFEKPTLSTKKWFQRDIENYQIDHSSDRRCGKKSIMVTIRADDRDYNCTNKKVKCQRAEARNQVAFRHTVFEEEWYGFSFKLVSRPLYQPKRMVIGQWKQPKDDSPVIAQRFTNGVFHITTEDKEQRIFLASSTGHPVLIPRLSKFFSEFDLEKEGNFEKFQTLVNLSALEKRSELLRGALNLEKPLQHESPDISSFETEELDKIFDWQNDVDLKLVRELDFLDDLRKYFGESSVEFDTVGNKLPVPSTGAWVDMVYRFKPGRTDNDGVHAPRRKGEIEIFADGDWIGMYTGNFGYPITGKPKSNLIYFKFGAYRDADNEVEFQFLFDEYKQGKTRQDVEVCSRQ
jgi:hypothetical protein